MNNREMKSMLEILEKIAELTNICHSLKSENDRLNDENKFLRNLIEKIRE